MSAYDPVDDLNAPQDSPKRAGFVERNRVRSEVQKVLMAHGDGAFEERIGSYTNKSFKALTEDAVFDIYHSLGIYDDMLDSDVEQHLRNAKGSSVPDKGSQFIESALQYAWGVRGSPRGDYDRLSREEVGEDNIRLIETLVLISQEVVRELHGDHITVYRENHGWSERQLHSALLEDMNPDYIEYRDNVVRNFTIDIDFAKMYSTSGESFTRLEIPVEDVGLAPDMALALDMFDNEAEIQLVGGQVRVRTGEVYWSENDTPYHEFVTYDGFDWSREDTPEFVRDLLASLVRSDKPEIAEDVASTAIGWQLMGMYDRCPPEMRDDIEGYMTMLLFALPEEDSEMLREDWEMTKDNV